MTKGLSLFRRFARDDRGAFAVLFGVMAIVLVAMAGAVIDYVTIQQKRATAQTALDAAVLALQPDIYSKSESTLKTEAQALVIDRLGDDDVTVNLEIASKDEDEGSLFFRAQLTIPTPFIGLINIPEMQVRIVSQATQKKKRLEVAFVLDNSGSMGSYSRMSNLKTAATNAINVLFDNKSTQPDVFVSVVPFAFFVNVGSDKKTANWMDKNGLSPTAKDNFADDEGNPLTGNFSRFDLYDGMTNESWEGCVESREPPYDTTDDTPTTSNPVTLFQPVFRPDEPDSGFGSSYLNDYGGSCPPDGNLGECECSSWTGGYYYGAGGTCELDPPTGWNQTGPNVCSCAGESPVYTSSWYDWRYGYITRQSCTDYEDGYVPLTDRQLQERACKYDGVTGYYSGEDSPNGECLNAEILPLTNNATTAKSSITAMVADGGTNIHIGTAWGWRTLSPGVPYTEGVDYDQGASKVLIVMTDGENTHYPSGNMNGAQYYLSYGFPYNERLGEAGWGKSALETEMNNRTVTTCNNAKNAGIEIYTIGLQPPNNTTKNMLTACATDASHAYFPNSPSELTSVFQDIADRLTDLRLAQ
ncbi:TadE/TadG family type IV pilus assembly protein [Cucumibacter marinus]|uniref:TadE/TadG family type IV pilus assembly protein n=1 Tax=Cucumibacter marinus TaxID=1121252 RepID=UPI0012DE517E|nr:TadE/TadG family type IV pilus assembly protein [Cucumibacter marinus]